MSQDTVHVIATFYAEVGKEGEMESVLLEMLEPKLDRLRELASRCSMDVFCGFSSESGQGGFTLDPDLLIRLGEIPGGGLNLDLYPPTEPG